MKHILVSMLALFPAALLAQDGTYVLKGKIGTLDAPAKLFLTYRANGTTVRDSAALQQGVFEFKGKVGDPVKASLVLRHGPPTNIMSYKSDLLQVYLEKGTIIVSGKDSVYNATIKGSRLNDDQQRLQAKLKATVAQRDQLTEDYIAAKEETRKSPEFRKSYDEKSKAIREEEKKIYQAFIKENPKRLK